MGRVLKRFLKQHGAYAAAGVAATARGIGEAAGGEGSEDQMFTIALASLFALGIIGGCADCTLRAEPRRPACKRYARPSLRRLLPMFLQRNDAILSIGDCFSGSLICPLDLSPLPERRTLAVAILCPSPHYHLHRLAAPAGGLLVGAALTHMLPESAELNEMLAGEEVREAGKGKGRRLVAPRRAPPTCFDPGR